MTHCDARSPGEKVNGIVYFGRMLDKIRAHSDGRLPADYQPNLGKGFDGSCVKFLRVDYEHLVDRTKAGGTDEDILQWCFDTGRRPDGEEIHVWNEYMRKSAWNDQLSSILERRKRESGMADRPEIRTMFDFIDADEGRPLREWQS
jgi:gluconokinase